jgi:hypothetical protein
MGTPSQDFTASKRIEYQIYIYITTDKTPHGGGGRWPDKDRWIYTGSHCALLKIQAK